MTHTFTQIDSTKLDAFPALRSYLRGMRRIPGGTFLMGTDDKTLKNDRKHRVTLADFSIGSYPVTTDIWREYCNATKSKIPAPPAWGFKPNHPMVNISWQQIMDSEGGFCDWVNHVSDVKVTLPTEAQFEYAACGGQFGTPFHWGKSFHSSNLWCSTKRIGDAKSTATVFRQTRITVNPYGLTDMTGNVWQWCLDWYAPYPRKSAINPVGPDVSTDELKCIRGGGWDIKDPFFFHVNRRYWQYRRNYDDNVGFRLVLVG